MEVPSGVGVRLGGLDLQTRIHKTGYTVAEITGWWEPTASTGAMVQRVGESGGWLTQADSMGRRLVVKGSIDSDSHAESEAMWEALTRALPVRGVTPFVVVEDGVEKHVMIRQEDQPTVKWLTDTHLVYDFQAHSRDYRRLSGDGTAPTYSETVGLPFTEGGWILPVTLPAAIMATVQSGSVMVRGVGSAPAPVTVTFRGPVSQPGVRSAVTGESMLFDLDVLAGQSLVVDLDARTVLLNGVRRRNAMRGQWLVPVPNDVLVFDAAAYDPDARMTVSWFDSWK